MEHSKEYQLGRYRVVEQIEKVKDGFRFSITAYDEQTARELPWAPSTVIRFQVERVMPTLQDARQDLGIAVQLMKKSISGDMP